MSRRRAGADTVTETHAVPLPSRRGRVALEVLLGAGSFDLDGWADAYVEDILRSRGLLPPLGGPLNSEDAA